MRWTVVEFSAAAFAAVALVCLAVPANSADPAPDPVVATVDGMSIHRAEVVAAWQNLPEQYRRTPLESVFPALIQQMIEAKLVAAEARRGNFHKEPEMRRRLAAFEDQILGQAYVERWVEERITDDLLRAAHEKNIAAAKSRREVSARHILVETQKAAEAVIAELEKGADFAALAKERSTGPSSVDGGKLGFFRFEQMVEPFAAAAFALAPGEFTPKPVKTRFGYHVILVEDRRDSAPPDFAASREDIRAKLAAKLVGELIAKLRAGAEIRQFGLDGAAPKTKP